MILDICSIILQHLDCIGVDVIHFKLCNCFCNELVNKVAPIHTYFAVLIAIQAFCLHYKFQQIVFYWTNKSSQMHWQDFWRLGSSEYISYLATKFIIQYSTIPFSLQLMALYHLTRLDQRFLRHLDIKQKLALKMPRVTFLSATKCDMSNQTEEWLKQPWESQGSCLSCIA